MRDLKQRSRRAENDTKGCLSPCFGGFQRMKLQLSGIKKKKKVKTCYTIEQHVIWQFHL